jgi:ornithine carbamoyltransferase
LPVAVDISGRDLISLKDFSSEEIIGMIDTALALKAEHRAATPTSPASTPCLGQSIAMIFQKRSTRTRVSTETGIFKLGGHGLFLGSEDVQLGVNETVRDSAMVLSRFNDLIGARVFAHDDVEELARWSDVPVINMLSDKFHPLQLLADMMTLREHYGEHGGRRISWVGDGNNITHSLMVTAPKLGYDLRVATPEGYDVHADVRAEAERLAGEHGTEMRFTTDPQESVAGAHVIVTDTWVSMGQEEEKAGRLRAFEGYQVTSEMAAGAAPDWVFLHCLPRKPEEVSDEVMYSDRSLVWDEAENRMWTMMAVMKMLLHPR